VLSPDDIITPPAGQWISLNVTLQEFAEDPAGPSAKLKFMFLNAGISGPASNKLSFSWTGTPSRSLPTIAISCIGACKSDGLLAVMGTHPVSGVDEPHTDRSPRSLNIAPLILPRKAPSSGLSGLPGASSISVTGQFTVPTMATQCRSSQQRHTTCSSISHTEPPTRTRSVKPGQNLYQYRIKPNICTDDSALKATAGDKRRRVPKSGTRHMGAETFVDADGRTR
jgi:hypothetical protein